MEMLAEMQRRERELETARKKYDEMMKKRYEEEQNDAWLSLWLLTTAASNQKNPCPDKFQKAARTTTGIQWTVFSSL